jgi:nucleoside-diphosphate-sugar epimerase
VEGIWHVSGHIGALNQAFFITNPQPVQVAQFFEAVAQRLGIPYHPHRLTREQLERFYHRALREHPEDPLMDILYRDAFVCSGELLKQATGYVPRIGFEQGLSETIRWYQAQPEWAQRSHALRLSV